jgi:A/G-specific adenine glycosylase
MLSEDYRINFHLFDRDELNIFRRTILTWYDDNRRQLPWRRPLVSTSSVNSYQDKSIVEPIKTKNSVEHAYAVWISEVMCQQTQVATVINYYTRWIEKFPTLEALAVSSVEDVNKVWSGLGYYARARRLREAAIKIMKDFDGKLPESSEELRTLPGIGLYTASKTFHYSGFCYLIACIFFACIFF